MNDTLRCYISGANINGRKDYGIISFAVPDYGILFRCYAEGSQADLEIIAFLSFLRFADHNIDIFKKKELLIYTDSPVLVFIMNHESGSVQKIESVRREAKKFTKRLRFKVLLTDARGNRAAGSIVDIPEMPIGSELKIKAFAGLAVQKAEDNRRDGLKM